MFSRLELFKVLYEWKYIFYFSNISVDLPSYSCPVFVVIWKNNIYSSWGSSKTGLYWHSAHQLKSKKAKTWQDINWVLVIFKLWGQNTVIRSVLISVSLLRVQIHFLMYISFVKLSKFYGPGAGCLQLIFFVLIVQLGNL